MADKTLHLLCAVEHCVIHIYVNDGSSVLDLLRSYLKGFVVLAFRDETGEFP